jgi:hypothetical protein
LLGGPQQVLEGNDLGPQIAEALHGLGPLFSQPPTSLPISSSALVAKA